MRLRLGRVRHAVIVAPHPDDEVIGAAGLIHALRRRATRVSVVIVSDGAASHPGSLRWPRSRLVAERRRESRRALLRLGVHAGAIRCLGLPDGSVAAHATRTRRSLRGIVSAYRADLIVGPAASDGHPDHRAVASALRDMPGRARRLTYQVWPARHRHDARTRTMAVAGGGPMKRSLIRLHRTQSGAIVDDPAGFAIAPHELRLFSHPIESFVAVRR